MHMRTVRIGIAAAALGLVVLVIVKDHSEKAQVAETHAETEYSHSEAELKAFWNEHLKDVEAFVMTGKFRIPEITARYEKLYGLIVTRYGRGMHINLSPTYNPRSRAITAANIVRDGVPTMELIIPKVYENYRDFRASGDPDWKERLENTVAIAALHEMDHLAFGYAGTVPEEVTGFAVLMERERLAWAETCEHTLRVFVEQYRAPINQSDGTYYTLWVSCGKNPDDPRWIAELRALYSGSLDGRTFIPR